jgi:MFS family permease
MWWTRREQSYRTIAYQISVSVASIIGPLMAYGIGHATKGIKQYQGIFLFIGAVSLGFAPLVFYLLPNGPTTARFLRHGNDRLIAIERMRENNTGTKVPHAAQVEDRHQKQWLTFAGFKVEMAPVLGGDAGSQDLDVDSHVHVRCLTCLGSLRHMSSPRLVA